MAPVAVGQRSRSTLCLVLGVIALLSYFSGQNETFVGGASSMRRSKISRQAEGGATGDRMALKILTPDGSGTDQLVGEISLPGVEGRLGVLKGHAPMLAPLDTGVLRYKVNDEWVPAVVMGGFANVADDKVSVLCSEFEQADDLGSVADLKTALDEATKSMTSAESASDKLKATTDVKKASARLQAATMIAGKR